MVFLMLDGFVKKSPVKLKDLAEYMNIAAPSLCKIMKAKFYMSNDDYDKDGAAIFMYSAKSLSLTGDFFTNPSNIRVIPFT